MGKRLRIVQLEERIVLDAAVAAVVANAVAAAGSSPQTGVAPIIYVDAQNQGSVHDGSTWATAYTDLQSALDAAGAASGSEQVWVAQGVYTPSQVYTPDGVPGGALGLTVSNMSTFLIPDGVEIYGGFKAGAVSLSSRSPGYLTVLSGDLQGNDINNPLDSGYAASKADNSWHVVTVGSDVSYTGANVRLDGLSIINGYANGPEGSPFFTPLLANNYNFGGGLYANFDSTVVLDGVTFQYNFAASDGGGVFTNNSNLLVMNSTFDHNSAIVRAGALEAWSTFDTAPHQMIVTNSVFTHNTAAVFGGAIVAEGTYASQGSAFYVDHSFFQGNVAGEGGAITVDSLNVYVNQSTFLNNEAHVAAGAIAETNVVNTFVGGPIDLGTYVYDSVFQGNVARGDVGYHYFMNHLFDALGASINFSFGGGALVNYMHGNLYVSGSLFQDNQAVGSDGGAILSGSSSSFTNPGGYLIAAGVNTFVADSVFVNNEGRFGGAIAALSDIGYLAAPNVEANVIAVTGSTFQDNFASIGGGAIALDGVTAEIQSNKFFGKNDALVNGDQMYAVDSMIEGVLTSNSAGVASQLLAYNAFKQFSAAEDLYLL